MRYKIAFVILLLIVSCDSIQDDIKIETSQDYIPNNIINMHDHVQDAKLAEKIIEANKMAKVSTILLVGSPEATLLTGRVGFSGHDKNNGQIIEMADQYSDSFIPFCTIDPKDEDKLEKLKKCTEQGSLGLKLYSGHTMFYDLPLNDPGMDEIYAYCEENKIPLLWHVNAGKFQEDFEAVLKKYPDLIVNCPHFCLSTIKIDRLYYLMDTYPNLYTDVSFGGFAADGLKRLSRNTSKFIPFFEKYPDRILFGTDMVITHAKRKTVDYIYNNTMCYRNLLESEKYNCTVSNDVTEQNLNGLHLSPDILKKIYNENPYRFLSAQKANN